MGNIPLPALSTQGNFMSPLDEYMRASQLRGMQQQQQMQQQELTLRNQQIKDQTALTSAMKDWNPDDGYDALEKSALNYGASGNAALQIRQHAMDIQQKANALTQEARDNYVKNSKSFGDMLQGTENVPDEELHGAASQVVMNGIKNKILDPQEGQSYLAGIQRTEDPAALRTQIDHIAKLKQGAAAVMEQQKTQQGIKESAAKTEEAEAGEEEKRAQTAKLQQETQGLVGPMAEAKYRQVLTALSAGKQVGQDDLDFAHGYELANKKSTTQNDTLGVTQTSTSGPAGMAALGRKANPRTVAAAPPQTVMSQPTTAPTATPQAAPAAVPARPAQAPAAAPAPAAKPAGAKDSLVDMIGQYKLAPTMLTRLMTKHPEVLAEVGSKYPDWDQPNYNAKNRMLENYTSGSESKSINAISTALGHAGELGTAIDALNNWDTGGSKTLRSLANKLGVEFGGDKVTTFNTIVHRLAPEISQAYISGGGGEGERAADAKDFDAALGGNQLKNNLAETVKLLRSKISAQEQQWNNTFKPTRPGDDFSTRFLTPQAKDALSRYGGGAFGGGAGGVKPKTAAEFMAKHGMTSVPQQQPNQ